MTALATVLATPAFGVSAVAAGRPSVAAGTAANVTAGKSVTASGAPTGSTVPLPPKGEPPSKAFIRACTVDLFGTVKGACQALALSAFDKARAAEGLGPMTLPTDYGSLTAAQQLLVLANLERVDRGLIPIAGLTSHLDRLARHGAKTGSDPTWPNPIPGDAVTVNEADGTRLLLSEYYWEYDDIYPWNRDCPKKGGPGCWDHRQDTLWNFGAPLVEGAAQFSAGKGDLSWWSQAEEFIGGFTKLAADPVLKPTWKTISSHLPIGVASGLSVRRNSSAALRIWASGEDMSARVQMPRGSQSFSISDHCPPIIKAGTVCTVTVTNTDPTAGPDSGALNVIGPNGTRVVVLSVRQPAPSLAAIKHETTSVGFRKRFNMWGSLLTSTGHPIRGQTILLQRSLLGPSSWWQTVATKRTTSRGRFHLSTRPSRSAKYRLQSANADGYPPTTSKPVRVDVTASVTAHPARRTISRGDRDTVTVKSEPTETGPQGFFVEARAAGYWQTIGGDWFNPGDDTARFAIKGSERGTSTYRIQLLNDPWHRASHSKPFTIRVSSR